MSHSAPGVAWSLSDSAVVDSPVVAFAREFLDAINRWEFKHGKRFAGATWRLGDDLITYRDGDQHRVWRLTGDVDEHGGYIAVWPD